MGVACSDLRFLAARRFARSHSLGAAADGRRCSGAGRPIAQSTAARQRTPRTVTGLPRSFCKQALCLPRDGHVNAPFSSEHCFAEKRQLSLAAHAQPSPFAASRWMLRHANVERIAEFRRSSGRARPTWRRCIDRPGDQAVESRKVTLRGGFFGHTPQVRPPRGPAGFCRVCFGQRTLPVPFCR